MRRLLPALVAALAVLPFLGALEGRFLGFDDYQNLLENDAWRPLGSDSLRWMLTEFHFGHWHPLTWLSFAVDHALWGLEPRGFHATNLVLHGLCAALAFLVFREVLERTGPAADASAGRRDASGWALLAALLFAVHPLRVESVAWITERRDVLSGAFWLLAVLAWLRAHPAGAPTRRGWYATSIGALALSLSAKAWGITLPVVLLVLDVYPLRRLDPSRTWSGARRLVIEKLPHFALALGAALLAQAAQREVGAAIDLTQYSAGHRLWQTLYGAVFYPWKTLWPTDLTPLVAIQDVDWSHWRFQVAAGVFVAVTAAALLLCRRAPALLAAWVVYGVVVSPVLGILQSGPQLVADRYSYLAALPLVLLLVGGARSLALRSDLARHAMPALGALVVLVLGMLAHGQTRHWRDNLSLWSRVLAVDPDATLGRYNYASALHEEGRFEEALPLYAGLTREHPEEARSWRGLAKARFDLEEWEGALAAWARAAALEPLAPEVREWRVLAALELDDPGRAARLADRHVEASERSADALLLRAQVHARAREYDAARALVLEVLRNRPNHPRARAALRALPG